MNFLNVFEERIGGIFGSSSQSAAPFSFKKLAKKAAHEMENETYVINGVDTAPALYTVLVSKDDDAAMRPLYADLTHEASQFLEAHAQRRGYTFVGSPLVRFMVDPSLKSGKFSVFAENVDERTLARLREEEVRFAGVGAGIGGAAAQQAVALGYEDPQAVDPNDPQAGLDAFPADTALEVIDDAYAMEHRAPARSQAQAVPAMDIPEVSATPQNPVAPRASSVPDMSQVPQVPQVTPQDAGYRVPVPSSFEKGQDAFAAPASAAKPVPQPRTQMRNVPLVGSRPAPQQAPVTQSTNAILIDRQTGRTYTATAARCVIGRERTTGGIVLHDPNVSRRHAELTNHGGYWSITDLNSTNGTLVNDVDIDECALHDGDLITLGLTNLEFREG